MSTLEAFRKQAKQLVRWHRDRDYSIGGRIRLLPRYKNLTDVEALALKFPLAEAQEIIALEAGFDSWSALKAAHESGAPSPKRSHANGAPQIMSAIPVLFVTDVANSAAFFRDTLGFTIDFLHGHPAFYAGISRDGATLHLRFVHERVISRELREQESLLAAFLLVESVKGLFEEYKTKGAIFHEPLHKEPWGGPIFTVVDLDDNRICFCEA
jgi:catechol 2,3-dioxygenase-like lactoylglutathione lyase family enzyme